MPLLAVQLPIGILTVYLLVVISQRVLGVRLRMGDVGLGFVVNVLIDVIAGASGWASPLAFAALGPGQVITYALAVAIVLQAASGLLIWWRAAGTQVAAVALSVGAGISLGHVAALASSLGFVGPASLSELGLPVLGSLPSVVMDVAAALVIGWGLAHSRALWAVVAAIVLEGGLVATSILLMGNPLFVTIELAEVTYAVLVLTGTLVLARQ